MPVAPREGSPSYFVINEPGMTLHEESRPHVTLIRLQGAGHSAMRCHGLLHGQPVLNDIDDVVRVLGDSEKAP